MALRVIRRQRGKLGFVNVAQIFQESTGRRYFSHLWTYGPDRDGQTDEQHQRHYTALQHSNYPKQHRNWLPVLL